MIPDSEMEELLPSCRPDYYSLNIDQKLDRIRGVIDSVEVQL